MVDQNLIIEFVENGPVVWDKADESPSYLGQLFLAYLETKNMQKKLSLGID